MQRTAISIIALVLLIGLSGCGSNYDKNDQVLGELFTAMEDLTKTYETVKDPKTAQAAAKEIDQISERLEELVKRMEKLPKLTKEEKERLMEKYAEKMRDLQEKNQKAVTEAGRNAQGDETFRKAIERLENVSQEMAKVSKKLEAAS